MERVVLTSPEMRSFVENMHALKRMAEPEEIARPILHLASEARSFITGTAFLVDGGVSSCRPRGFSPPRPGTAGRPGRRERKSVWEGKSGSVRVALGGGRHIN